MTCRIAVLGCGPAGLVAANTVEQMGHEAVVFSQPKRSYIAGAQYSHEPVLGFHDRSHPDTMIQVRKQGTREGYALKVYGDADAPVSWSEYPAAEYPAWGLREAYDALWRHWQDSIVPCTLRADTVRQAASSSVLEGTEIQGLISTIPLPAVCLDPAHRFAEQQVHIAQYEDKFPRDAESFILYNGEEAPAWYRESVILGTHAYEWSTMTVKRKPPVEGIVKITKPVKTNCDCYHDTEVKTMLAGRYGRWDKNQLISDVQRDVVDFCWEWS